MSVKHPAPYSQGMIPRFAAILGEHTSKGAVVLDPFAGIGRIHQLRDYGYQTVGVELEPEWALQSPYTMIGDATKLPFTEGIFDAVVSSPCYGNRLADSHSARDGSYRHTYTHVLGRPLSNGSAGALQWGDEYRALHAKAWAEVERVLVPGGIFVLNIKDHQRNKRRAHVSNWHFQTLLSLGLSLVDVSRVPTPGFRRGENREVRYPERLLTFEKTGGYVTPVHFMLAVA